MSTANVAAASSSALEVDASVWRAVAGASVKIPSVNSYVYYFPEGHVERCPSSSSSSFVFHDQSFNLNRPMIPCQVLAVRFLADPSSDQGFVKFLLQPLEPLGPRPSDPNDSAADVADSNVVSFVKVLTASDANNGGGFSVPKFCADEIFPRLDFGADPPVQVLTMKDVCNHAWEFRHIFRGTPRRHLLTTGWSKFVNCKRLVAGDAVVFVRKKPSNELFVGIRRAVKSASNDVRCVEEVLGAIEKAAKGMAFEVVYYPKAGLPDFVVKAEKVKESLRRNWSPGMRVRMAVETEDSSRMTWFLGTVQSAMGPDRGPWVASPWRMLQVIWDEADKSLRNMQRVNPWKVEYVTPESELPLPKRLKVVQNPGTLVEGDRCLAVPNLIRSAGQPNSLVLTYSPLPSGVQGARPSGVSLSGPSSSANQATVELPVPQKDKTVSTIQSVPESSSPGGTQDSLHPAAHKGHGSSSSALGPNSFQLFGKVIQVGKGKEAVEGCSRHKQTTGQRH